MWKLIQIDFKKTNKFVFLLPFISSILILLFAGISINFNIMEKHPWESYLLQTSMVIALFFPICMTLMCSNIANTEHRSNMWKQIFTFPLKKNNIYYAKLLECLLIELFIFLFVITGFLIMGFILIDKSEMPLLLLLKAFAYLIIAYIPTIAFQLWLSLIIKNQAFPLIIGIFLTIFSYTFNVFPFDIGRLLLWTFPSSVLPISLFIDKNQNMSIIQTPNPVMYVGISIVASLLIIILSKAHFINRDIH